MSSTLDQHCINVVQIVLCGVFSITLRPDFDVKLKWLPSMVMQAYLVWLLNRMSNQMTRVCLFSFCVHNTLNHHQTETILKVFWHQRGGYHIRPCVQRKEGVSPRVVMGGLSHIHHGLMRTNYRYDRHCTPSAWTL